MRNVTGRVAAMLFPLAVASMPLASASPATAPELTPRAGNPRNGVPPAQGRLKFKSAGPVCMCGDGLSERDIEQALAKSTLDQSVSQAPGSVRAPSGGGEKNLNFGGTK